MFITPYNYINLPAELVQEEVSDEVVVEPSEAFTTRELIYRIAMGMPVSSGTLCGEYPDRDADFDDDLPTDRPDFDLADYSQLKTELEDKYETITRKKQEKNAIDDKVDQNIPSEINPAEPEPLK